MYPPRNTLKSVIIVMIVHLTKCDDFLEEFGQVVPTPPPTSIGALPKCGEGTQKDKFKCVPYFNCDPSTNTTIDYPEVDGSNNIEPRREDRDRSCDYFLEVCCRIANATITSTELVPTIELQFEPKCGFKSNNSDPWMVALFNSSDEKPESFCGGSLITPVAVLTAAHCVEKFQPNQIKISAGDWNLHKTKKKGKSVSEIIIHEHYFSSTLYNDLAILILDSSFSETDNVGTICISRNPEGVKSDCLLTGWNKNSNSEYSFSKKNFLSLVSNKLCETTLRKEIGDEFILDHSFICALGDSRNDACKGDGGGPLICPDSGQRYFQMGIASWGVNCYKSTPGVYTNVVQFKDWIDDKLEQLGYSANPYSL